MRAGVLATIVMAAAFLAYVINTFLYLTPPNPLTARLLPIIYRFQHPLFAQNWHLFAPNPVRHNMVLAVRCRTGVSVSDWYDAYAGVLSSHHRNRLSPMGKVLRVPQNAMYAFMGKSADEWRPLICARFPGHRACGPDYPGIRRQQALGAFVMQRLGSTVCRERSRRAVAAVQVRILIHKPPLWSGRHLPSEAGETTYFTLPWMEYQPVGFTR